MIRALMWLVWLALRLYTLAGRKPHCTFLDPSTQSPYLSRWWLGRRDVWPDALGRTGQQGWYLHCFHRSDLARELHSHPTKFMLAFVLRGGYREQRREGRFGMLERTENTPGTLNVITQDTFHRTTLIGKASWSLCYFGPRGGSWGFAKDDGTIERADHFDGRTGALTPRKDTDADDHEERHDPRSASH